MKSRCPRCEKPAPVCVCDRIEVFHPHTRVLVLQHPQEPDVVLGTAKLLELALPEAVKVRPGLSWPSLASALGEAEADLSAWGVLWRAQLPRPLSPEEEAAPVLVLDPKGRPHTGALEGIVALDGTWSQAKSLWWRNPWLLRLNRVLLCPTEPSIYGKLRAEPRREAVSTLEAVTDALVFNGEDPALRASLRRVMRTMVQRARDNPP